MDRMEPIIYEVLGQPVAKGRARSVQRGKFIAHVTPDKTRMAEQSFLAQALPYKPAMPLEGPLKVSLAFIMQIPESKSKKWKGSAMAGAIMPCGKKNDLDNLAKTALDAMNQVFYEDDGQIVVLDLVKVYGGVPKTIVRIEMLGV